MAPGNTARDREGPRERGPRREDGPAHPAERTRKEGGKKERRRTLSDVGARPVAEGAPHKKRRLSAGSQAAAKRTGADDGAVAARAESRSAGPAGNRAAAAARVRSGGGACASTKKLNAANAWADQYISVAREEEPNPFQDSEGEGCDGESVDPGIAEVGADDSDVWMDEEDLPESTMGPAEEESASVDAVKKMAGEIKNICGRLRDNSGGKLWSRRPGGALRRSGATTVVVTPRAAAMLKQVGERYNRFRACCFQLWPGSKALLRDMFFDVILKVKRTEYLYSDAAAKPNGPTARRKRVF
ncbi:MAG: hypothetical protein BJ554DRAFT_6354 [Olpidium bornovanus]|uniref:Uncharacterized protein n=1 Tax=Olpidium bornovanus TaxID=278681 RepID=A0A8H8DK88_9FUNG|nr:MAG: hypothetical protein BJ554DRAFT_6354 [Olpidium bornovanus]